MKIWNKVVSNALVLLRKRHTDDRGNRFNIPFVLSDFIRFTTMNSYDDPTSLAAATAVATETVESHAVDDQGYFRPRGDSTNSDFSQSPLNTTTAPLMSRHESMSGSISSTSSATSRPARRHQYRRQIRSLDGHTSSHPPITSRRLSLHSPNRESSFRRASITPSDRDMFGLTRGGSVYGGDHYHDAGDAAGSPPSSPSHLSTSLQVPSMPTKGLLNSLAAAAHYSGMAAVSPVPVFIPRLLTEGLCVT